MPQIDLTPFENNENITVDMCLQMMHMMKGMIESMSHSMESMAQTLEALEENQKQLTHQLTLANEKNEYLTRKLFGRSKETINEGVTGQLNLFTTESPTELVPEEQTELKESIVKSHIRRRVGQKQEKIAHFPTTEQHYRLSEEECICETCGSKLTDIGTTELRSELIFWAAEITKAIQKQHAYVCRTCESNGQAEIKKAHVPKPMIANSLGSNSIVLETIRQKFVQKVPAYRQEEYWQQTFDLSITRDNITNWHRLVVRNGLDYLAERLLYYMKQDSILYADETTYHVLESQKKKTYYWQFCTGSHSQNPVVLYLHNESRAGTFPKKVLKDFSGYLHCDGYQGYNQLPNVQLVYCLAHARRKFFEAIPKGSSKKPIPASIAVQMIDVWFELERKWATLLPEERLEKRKAYLWPLFVNFYEWLGSFQAASGSKLEQAVTYAYTYKRGFERIFEDGRLELSNNRSERNIKELVIGRKNWLHSASLDGAWSSGIILSILRTARANELNPMSYLAYLFEQLPNLAVLDSEHVDRLLPWCKEVKEHCLPLTKKDK